MRAQLVATVLRAATRPTLAAAPRLAALPTRSRAYSDHPAESFESFTQRYVEFFNQAEDIFEVQRGLNNCFAHDLVPAPSVVEAAVRASRRVDDFATAVRIFNGVKVKGCGRSSASCSRKSCTRRHHERLAERLPLRRSGV
uniref:Cytochrome c oxidase subunit 6, mitochondrial n=1 Tax=Mycena chlorophos TaxID=658473 RepID=A0ABQ0M466_MYCCL|nr:COX5A subunit VA of cytochrome C oxidase [Mycena chlorophos]